MPEEASGVTACSSEKKGGYVSVHYSFETGSLKVNGELITEMTFLVK